MFGLHLLLHLTEMVRIRELPQCISVHITLGGLGRRLHIQRWVADPKSDNLAIHVFLVTTFIRTLAELTSLWMMGASSSWR